MIAGRDARALPNSAEAGERPIQGWELRQYQADVTADFERMVSAGKRGILLVAPTATGKTVIGAAVIREFAARWQNVLGLAHRRESIDPTGTQLPAHAITH